SQMARISEHCEFLTGKESIMGNRPFIDYLYQNSAAVDGQWNGMWGILRVYNGRPGLKADLQALPNNTAGAAAVSANDGDFPIDSASPSGVTDYKDTTDASVGADTTTTTDTTLMSPDMVADVQATGAQGAMVAPDGGATGLLLPPKTIVTSLPTDFSTGKSVATGICPATAPKRTINVTAVSATAL